MTMVYLAMLARMVVAANVLALAYAALMDVVEAAVNVATLTK